MSQSYNLITLLVLLLTSTVAQSTPLTTLQFTEIPAGQFIMGTSNLEAAVAEMPEPDQNVIKDETPAHKVIFQKSFLLSTTEVTQQDWLAIMGTKPGPAEHWTHPQWQLLPVVSVSWHDTQTFINKLNQQSKSTQYRLPTESEWEYAARAGNTELRPFDLIEMDEYAWYLHSSDDLIQPVATKQANAWGLHDMYGSVWEWVSDWYSPSSYTDAKPNNPQGPPLGSKKVRRGGSYHCPPHMIRSAYRSADLPTRAYSVVGFRLVAIKK